MTDDPRRWAEDPEAPEGLAGALREAREELPSEEQIAAVATKLGPLLGGGGGAGGGGAEGLGSGSAGAGAAVAGLSSGTKVVIFLLGGTLIIASLGTWAVIEDRRARPVQWPVDAGEIVPDGGATPVANGGVDGSTEGELGAEEELGTGTETGTGTGTGAGTGSGERGTGNGERGTGNGERGTETETETEAPSELSLLREAQDVLVADPGRALGLADEHVRLYPAGALAQEREVLAVDALLRLGRREAAEARASRFRAAHPGSSQIRRLDRLLRQ